MKRFVVVVLVLAAMALVLQPAASHALWGEAQTRTTDGDAQMGLGEYKGLKHAIGCMDFENEAGWRGQWEIGQNLAVMLESALYDTGRFVLVEREQLGAVLLEQDLAAGGRMAKTKDVAATGRLRPARYIGTGAVTEVDVAQSGGAGGINFKGFNVGLGRKEAQVTIIAKLIDTTTGEIVAKKRIVGNPGSTTLDVGYRGSDLGLDLGGFKKTPLGQAAQDAINQAAKFFAQSMEEFPFEGSVVKATDDGQVIINRGSEFGVEEGQELVMRTEGEVLIDPDTGAVLDREEGRDIGRLKVARVREKIAYCDVIEGEKGPESGTVVLAR